MYSCPRVDCLSLVVRRGGARDGGELPLIGLLFYDLSSLCHFSLPPQANILKTSDTLTALMLEICVARTLAPAAQKVPAHLEAAFAVIDFMQMVRGWNA